MEKRELSILFMRQLASSFLQHRKGDVPPDKFWRDATHTLHAMTECSSEKDSELFVELAHEVVASLTTCSRYWIPSVPISNLVENAKIAICSIKEDADEAGIFAVNVLHDIIEVRKRTDEPFSSVFNAAHDILHRCYLQQVTIPIMKSGRIELKI